MIIPPNTCDQRLRHAVNICATTVETGLSYSPKHKSPAQDRFSSTHDLPSWMQDPSKGTTGEHGKRPLFLRVINPAPVSEANKG